MENKEILGLYEAYLDVYELDEAREDEGLTPYSGDNYSRYMGNTRKESYDIDLYDLILSHLLDEGYANTEESAESIMVNMSEDWREEILDEAFKDLDAYKTELVSGKAAQLASDILKNRNEVRRLSKKPLAKFRPGVKRKMKELVSQSKKKYGLYSNAKDALIKSSVSRSANTTKKIEDLKKKLPGNNVVPFNREELEYLFCYLVDEGYADSLEAAEGIMVCMSEEWRDSIFEAAADQSDKQIEKGVKTTYKATGVLANQASRGLNRLPSTESDEKTERMRGRLKTRRDDLFKERDKREDEQMSKYKKMLGL